MYITVYASAKAYTFSCLYIACFAERESTDALSGIACLVLKVNVPGSYAYSECPSLCNIIGSRAAVSVIDVVSRQQGIVCPRNEKRDCVHIPMTPRIRGCSILKSTPRVFSVMAYVANADLHFSAHCVQQKSNAH